YQRGSAGELTERLASKTDRLNITDQISADEDMKEIKKKIDAHNTVMLWDISTSKRNSIFKYCYENSKRIYSAPNISDIILNGAEPVNLFDTPLLLTEANPFEYEERVIKRLFDIILSLFLIILLSPLMLITALCIKISDRGPVFYRQIRCTKNAREFTMLKFRSMIVDAEKNGVAVLAREKDPRITPVGAVIRKLRIDELPQLFNVLKGDMSFVGPRPERPEFIRKYLEDMPEFSYRMKIRAGITGYAQLYGKYNTKPYDKLKFDLYYMEQYSLWLDIRLIILTVKILFTKESTEGAKEDVSASGIDNNPGS
ncbi:MAG: exopolysaccharide biosynthesis polyprenyl glycosylphosphotransferase, partial [Lachnospiraceae bacterium]|nr:exopolysaccharide biosynthesis polyprenyl glycosylphosphotransferase [Lachnospiraceae bacterium]